VARAVCLDVAQATEPPQVARANAPATLSAKGQAVVNEAVAQAKADTNKGRSAQTNPLSPPNVQPNVSAVHAPQAWAQGYDGTGVVVSLMYAGVRWTHEA